MLCIVCYAHLIHPSCPFCRADFSKLDDRKTIRDRLHIVIEEDNESDEDEDEIWLTVQSAPPVIHGRRIRQPRRAILRDFYSSHLWRLSEQPTNWEIKRAVRIRERHRDFIQLLVEEMPDETIFQIEVHETVGDLHHLRRNHRTHH